MFQWFCKVGKLIDISAHTLVGLHVFAFLQGRTEEFDYKASNKLRVYKVLRLILRSELIHNGSELFQ